MRDLLKQQALDLLNNPSFEGKIQTALKIGELAQQADDQPSIKEFLVPTQPARDSSWTYDAEKEIKNAKVTDKAERLFLMLDASYLDVEINAMETSAVLFLMGDSMPLDFYKDYASHISDEARHAQTMIELMKLFPQFTSQRTYSNRVWNKVIRGKTILEKIMIENVIEEGWAADRTVGLIQDLQNNGHPKIAEVFKNLNDDEIRHSAIGNKWAMKLLGQDEEKYFDLFESLSASMNPDVRRVDSIKTRLASGFSKGFVKKYF